MARYYFGTDELVHGWDDYFELCNAFELDFQRYEEPPTRETLHRWRVESPKNFCFILRAPPVVRDYLESAADAADANAPGDAPERIERAWSEMLEDADALAARALHVPTAESLRPGEAHRKRLASFAEQHVDGLDRPVLWEPSGLWTIEQTRAAADETGLTPVYDPFIAHREGVEFRHGDVGFALSERPGMRRQFDLFDFRELLDWTQKYDRVFIMLRGRHKWAHAQHLADAIEQSPRAH